MLLPSDMFYEVYAVLCPGVQCCRMTSKSIATAFHLVGLFTAAGDPSDLHCGTLVTATAQLPIEQISHHSATIGPHSGRAHVRSGVLKHGCDSCC